MGVWVREILGWVLLGVGLAAFAMCYAVFLLNRWIIEAFIAAFIGVTIFRAGLHLLKVATAARAARDVKRELAPTGGATRRVRPGLAQPPTGRERPSVLPGPKAHGDREPARPRR
jgi:hypothetical protein